MSEAQTPDPFDDKCFQEFLEVVHRYTGITIAPGRKSMLQGRLRKRLLELGIARYADYLERVKTVAAEKPIFIDLVTTNETYFFRTPRIWDHIERTFLPEWYADHPNAVFNAWSAATSSGEEAHSLGVICQSFKKAHPGFRYRILGTDISPKMVALCKLGTYSGRSLESFRKLRPGYFDEYMRPEGTEYKTITDIRDRLTFQTHNLFERLKTSEPFDLILMRNVLIYFQKNDQEAVIANLRPALAEDGQLIIGESESLSHLKTDFIYREPLIYAKNSDKSKIGQAA